MAERELIYRLKVDTKTGKLALDQFNDALESTTKTAEAGAKRIKTAFDNTSKTLSEVGKGLTIGVTVPLVALAAAALKAGQDLDNAFDSIRVSTGATGEKLEALQSSFRKVFENVPDSADKVSAAIGQLNTRLGLSGPPLEALTTQILNLARLTGTDLNTVIEGSTRLFGAWNVATADQGKTLDFLFKVSQQTGIGMGALLQKVTQFAPVFREMGFSIEESAALLGKWEKAGVNAEIVLSGLRIAASKFSKEGITLREGLSGIIKQIQDLGPGAKSTALAVDAFGRSGVTMADAILKGRLSIDDLMKSLKASPETINKAYAATKGFAESFDVLKNKVLSALEPLGTELLNTLEVDVVPAMMTAIEAIKSMVKWFTDLPGPVKTAAIAFAALLAILGPMALAMSTVVSWAGNVAVTFATLAPKMIAVTGATTAMEAAAIGLGTALRFAGQAALVVGVAFVSWKFGEWIAGVTGLDEAFFDLGKTIFGTRKSFDEAAQAENQLQKITDKLNATLKSPLIKQAGESWDTYSDRVRKAAFEQTGIAEKLKKTSPEVGKVDEITKKLNATMLGNAKATKEAAKELEGLANTFGVKLVPISKNFQQNFEKVTVALLASGKSAGELEKDLLEMADAAKKAHEETKTLAQRTEDYLNSAEMEHDALMRNVDALDRMRNATIALNNAPDPLISTNDTLTAQMHNLLIVTQGWEKLKGSIGGLPEVVKPVKQAFEGIGQQISTVFNDLSKGIAEAIVEWKGFGETLKSIAKEFAKGILRTMIDGMLAPLTKEGGPIDKLTGKMQEQFQKLAGKIQDFFGKMFNKIGDFLKNFMSSTVGQIAGMVGGVALAIGGLKLGGNKGAAMTIGGGALAGAGLGAMLGPGGAAIGAAAGAAAGGLAVLVSKFTRRGKEKLEATKAAEELSRYVWQEVVPQVKAGLIGVEDGEKAIQAAFDAYQTYLRDNLKDQTVIARSIETQRITLTQGLAALDALKGELKGNEAVQILRDLGKEFLETGMMTDKFAASIKGAGGDVEFFNKMTSQIQGLQGLRAEFASLKQAIDELLPKQKTWQEEFLDTGIITDEMAEKIKKAGGDIEQFKKFAEMKTVRAEFDSLLAEFNKTGKASDRLLKLMEEFGGPDVVNAFRKLMAEAEKSGKTLGDLAKDSEGAANVIQGAFDSTGTGIDKAFTDAAKTLSDTLQEMDDNLGRAIASLQAAMVTMINDLIDVLLGVPGAAEKAARDANFFLGGIKDIEVRVKIASTFDDSGLRDAESRAAALAAIGFTGQPTIDNPVDSNSDPAARDFFGMPAPIRRFAEGTPFVPFTGLAMVHQGERITPASQNRGGMAAGSFTQTIIFQNVEDPNEQKRMLDRVNRQMLNDMRRQ